MAEKGGSTEYGGPSDSGGKGSGGPSDSGGGASGTSLAEGPSGPPTQNTVGASIGGSRTPMFSFGGTSFGASDGSAPMGEMPATGGFDSPSSWAASLGSPQGITASPTLGGTSASAFAAPEGGGGLPSDLTSQYDPLGSNISQGAGGPSSSGQMSPQDLGAPSAAPGAAGAKPAAGGGEKSVMESLGIKNPLGAAIGAAGLGYSMMQGQQQQKYSPEMQAQAARLDANGQKLMSYLQSGNLPPGLQASLTQATSAAKAKIISNFAAQGLNTDPTQNSVLAQQLASVDQQAIISTAQMGQQLMASGLAQSGLSSDLYKTLANIDQTQTANIGKAIAAFAASASGGGGGINLKLG